jgi:hypothetical protein
MRVFRFPVILLLFVFAHANAFAADDGIFVDRSQYANRQLLPDFTAAACPDTPRGLEQIKGNLYRHTTGAGLAVHSGLVLVTKEGALIIDPGMTCTATILRDEIKRRFWRSGEVRSLHPRTRGPHQRRTNLPG